MRKLLFSWYDYVLFTFPLVTSVLIGIYFGVIKKQDSAKDYLLGGKTMKVVPVAMSLVASCISALTLLGVPADVYKYGAIYWLLAPIMLLVTMVAYYVYYPVFYKLQITSMNEYLGRRFNSQMQSFASFLFLITNTLYLPIVIYIPALALSQATGFNVHVITPILCGICIIYTTLGGLKAVVWADTLQLMLMLLAIFAVLVMGIISTGGIPQILHIAKEHGRLDISMDIMDFTKRDTILSGTIGIGIMWLGYISANQICVQKCLSLPTYTNVKHTLTLFAFGMMLVISFSVFTGLIIFARYNGCDPLTTGAVEKSDQLLPFYVLDVAEAIPGLPGLFVSGIFSAALSTLAAVMNGMACTIYEDFMSRFMKKNISEKQVSVILKCLVVVIGIINTGLVFLVENLGGLLPLSFSFSGVATGPLLGLFSVGMLAPMVDSTSALCGGVVSLAVMTCIVFGQQWHQGKGTVLYPILPLSADSCVNASITQRTINNSTQSLLYSIANEEPFILFRISYYWYTLMGLIILITVSLIVSFFRKTNIGEIDKDLFSPIIHSLLPENKLSKKYSVVQTSDSENLKR